MKKAVRLKLIKKVELNPTVPFDFDSTFHKPAHFASGDNFWQPGIRWQTFWYQGNCLGVVFENLGSRLKPKIQVKIFAKNPLPNNELKDFLAEIRYRYNLDLDLTDFYRRFKNDRHLKPVIKRIYGMRPGHQNSLYEYLIIGVVLQNCTVRRSIQMMQVLFENYGSLLDFGGKRLCCFWPPGGLKNVSEEELRSLKIGYRAKFIKRIDDYFGKGLMDEIGLRGRNRETQMKELLKLYGVGPATVWYLLFDVFHQYDFFSHISPFEQKIYSKIFFGTDPEKPVAVEKLTKYFERYKPYQQLAVHYLWEDLWWKRKNKPIFWLEKLIRI